MTVRNFLISQRYATDHVVESDATETLITVRQKGTARLIVSESDIDIVPLRKIGRDWPLEKTEVLRLTLPLHLTLLVYSKFRVLHQKQK